MDKKGRKHRRRRKGHIFVSGQKRGRMREDFEPCYDRSDTRGVIQYLFWVVCDVMGRPRVMKNASTFQVLVLETPKILPKSLHLAKISCFPRENQRLQNGNPFTSRNWGVFLTS